MMENSQIRQLNAELQTVLKKAERGKKILNFFKIPFYGLSLAFLLFVLGGQFIIAQTSSPELIRWIVPVFIIICIAQLGFIHGYAQFARAESTVITKIIKCLFPGASYRSGTSFQLSERELKASRLFAGFGKNTSMPSCYTYGSIQINVDGNRLNIADIGVTFGRIGALMTSNGITGYFAWLYRGTIKPLFCSRIESAAFNFRGAFGWAKLRKKCPGDVMILPDHWEEKVGYLAQNLQALIQHNGSCLVKLENLEFERYFVVYADDEVAARYILTPALMEQITRLRAKYKRDLMFSFTRYGFYFAIPMPDGFLSLRGSQFEDGLILEEIYTQIYAASQILQDLHLK